MFVVMKISLVACSLFLLLAAACESGSTEPGPSPSPSPSPDPSSPTGGEPTCPTGSGPTHHAAGDLASDETWTAATSPHVVDGTLRVRDGKTLTIEPCAIVSFAAKSQLSVAFPGTPNRGAL